jgi:outer membrane immunogenic protein
VNTDLDLGGEWDLFPADRDLVIAKSPDNLDNDGAELGGLLGYNYQWRCWVLGLEADGGYLWARDSADSGIFSEPNLLDKHVRTSFKTRYLLTIAPRIGYACGRWLPYVTGGLAVGDLDFSQEIRTPDSDFRQGGSTDNTNAGWMVGGGLQYALTDHWSIRGQYQYIDLGDVDFSSAGNTVPTTGFHRAELTEHNVSFAVMYKF